MEVFGSFSENALLTPQKRSQKQWTVVPSSEFSSSSSITAELSQSTKFSENESDSSMSRSKDTKYPSLPCFSDTKVAAIDLVTSAPASFTHCQSSNSTSQMQDNKQSIFSSRTNSIWFPTRPSNLSNINISTIPNSISSQTKLSNLPVDPQNQPPRSPEKSPKQQQIHRLSQPSTQVIKFATSAKRQKGKYTTCSTQVPGSATTTRKANIDRFIPSRKTSQLNVALSEAHETENFYSEFYKGEFIDTADSHSIDALYKRHILGIGKESNNSDVQLIDHISSNNLIESNENESKYTYSSVSTNTNILRFNEPSSYQSQQPLKLLPEYNDKYSLIHGSVLTKPLKFQPQKYKAIDKIPFKVLDAPGLIDDFYLNLVDWSSTNVLAVSLSSTVYLWRADTHKVTLFCDLGPDRLITSIAWHPKGDILCIGTEDGKVEIWDAEKLQLIRTYSDHQDRVGSLGWSENMLACGSRDKTITLKDMRDSASSSRQLLQHKQEVCGLKWSFDNQQLASGGNDNKLFIWNVNYDQPICRFQEHSAAVKAIAWSPHQHGLLASGGGTQDRCIRFWNTQTASNLDFIDTGSQVCNLMFSKNSNQIVSTHGYSLNQIVIWKYPTMQKVAELTGHTQRVIYLAMSPNGQTIVTGAGDETLRFWNAFPIQPTKNYPSSVLVNGIRDLR